MMKPLDKLKVNSFLKQLENLEREEDYHANLYRQINAIFMVEVEQKLLILDQETQDKYGELLSEENIAETLKEEEYKEKTKEQIPPSLKKVYKKLLGKTHPDRFIDASEGEREEMEDIYKNVVECAETGDWLGLIKNAEKMNIEVKDLDDSVLPNIKKQIKKLRQSINNYKATYQWQWFHSDDEEKKESLVESYINTTLQR